MIQQGSANSNAVLVKFDHDGQHLWSNQYGLAEGPWTDYLGIQAITGSSDGKLYLAGFSNRGDFAIENIGFEDNILMQIEECSSAGPAVPTLYWTGESNYTNDGVDPDSGAQFSNFTFRVNYTDADNDYPLPIEVWVDVDDNGAYA